MSRSLRFHDALRSPRGLLLSFITLIAIPALALVYAGWEVVDQQRTLAEKNRQLESFSTRARLEEAPRLIQAALNQKQNGLFQQMAEASSWPLLSSDGHRLVVLGVRQLLHEAAPEAFAAGEAAEDAHAFDAAIHVFQDLANKDDLDPATKAGALLRLARVLRKAERLTDALKTYRTLTRITDVAIADGRPADLVGLHMQCAVEAQLELRESLKADATALRTALAQGRWQLDEATYSMYEHDVAGWLGDVPNDADESFRLAVEETWDAWQLAQHPGTGFESHRLIAGGSRVLFWRATGPRLVLLAVDASRLQQQWLAEVKPLLESQRVSLAFTDTSKAIPAPSHNDGSHFTRDLLSDQTHLPWTIRISTTDSAPDAAKLTARTVLFSASALFLAVVIAGSYFVGRAVHRELSVARLQSDFVSAVSHEFRTPLTSLRQIAEILSDNRVADRSRIADYYEKQLRATERLRRLVETLLDFGRMEAGSRPYHLAPLDVSQWIRGVVTDFQREGAGNHTIELATSNTSCTIDADAEALSHAVRNLLDNAVKYSPDRDTVSVNVEMVDGACAIRVRDQGLGIPPNEQHEIWRKFVRGSAARTHAIKGTGVGLAMVRYIVNAHHGRIHLSSHPGEGSTFTLLLPASGTR